MLNQAYAELAAANLTPSETMTLPIQNASDETIKKAFIAGLKIEI